MGHVMAAVPNERARRRSGWKGTRLRRSAGTLGWRRAAGLPRGRRAEVSFFLRLFLGGRGRLPPVLHWGALGRDFVG